MQVIIIPSNSLKHKHWQISGKLILILMLLVFTAFGYMIAQSQYWPSTLGNPSSGADSLSLAQINLTNDVVEPNEEAVIEQQFYAKQLGQLQAETIRLKLVIEKLAEDTDFDLSRYDFSQNPAQGGIERAGVLPDDQLMKNEISSLNQDLRDQSEILDVLSAYLMNKQSIVEGIPHGNPLKTGWISSHYGYRIDPFTGKKTFHHGVDIADHAGSQVTAVADGIVSWAGNKSGYGGLVEIDHGNGYVTRYAHNKTLKVKLGDRVTKGDVLALVGSTGRSTGPHVHFEILRDGRSVNPIKFIR